MKDMFYGDATIKFEAMFDTTLRQAIAHIPLDKQVELLDVVVADVTAYAEGRGVEVCRKTWNEYCKQVNWQSVADKVLEANKSAMERFRDRLKKLDL